MAESLVPGGAPVSLNEARSWLRLGATIDDAVVAGLVRAATSVCEAFIGRWLIVRAGEEILPLAPGGNCDISVNVTFPTSPVAAGKKPEGLKAQAVGDAGEGFVKYRLGG